VAAITAAVGAYIQSAKDGERNEYKR
jgi:hypothetical protein